MPTVEQPLKLETLPISAKSSSEVLVLGSGPAAMAIAAALSSENLHVDVLSDNDHTAVWPYTYGIWGDEVDDLGLSHLLEHRWTKTVSFFGEGAEDPMNKENNHINHFRDYGLFDKKKLQNYWIDKCNKGLVKWHKGLATNLQIDNSINTVTTSKGERFSSRLVIDATGYKPAFLKTHKQETIAVQTCYGIVGTFSKPPLEQDQFVLMDYRCDHLSKEEKEEPPTFLYAMDLGDGRFFLEETSLGLNPPLTMEKLQSRLNSRLAKKKIEIISIEHEEHGLFLPMNMPLPDLNQPIMGFGGSASMVHPASGYMVGGLLRRAPEVAKAIAKEMKDKEASPTQISLKGWEALWTPEMRKKQALYQFGLEKLMRFKESQLRDFFRSFFGLPSKKWYGFLTNTLTLNDLIKAMWTMFVHSPWNVRIGLMGMQGRELKLLWKFIRPLK